MENFYASVELLGDLLDKGTYCVGTARSNREYFTIDLIQGNNTSIGSFWFVTETRCEATTTTTMQENESAAVSSTISPVTAPLKLVSNPPTAESCEATAEVSGNQDDQGKCDDKIVALWWTTATYFKTWT